MRLLETRRNPPEGSLSALRSASKVKGVRVDVVVVSYNSRAHVRGCVEPLAGVQGIRVVVVDNASSDGCLETIADLPVDRIARPVNSGFAAGCNAGWRAGDAPAVLLLNPDARIDLASIGRLLDVLAEAPQVGAVAPKILASDGELEPSQRRFPAVRSTWARALFLHRIFPAAAWTSELVLGDAAYAAPASPDWVSGACLLLRRSALEAIGGLDEGFFLYGEDIDLARRLRDADYDIRFEPAAVATHAGGASGPRASLLPVLALSRLRYLRKHESRAHVLAARAGLAVTALTHAVVSKGGLSQRRGHLRAFLLLAFNRTAEADRATDGAAGAARSLVAPERLPG